MPEAVGDILRRHFQSGDYLAAFEAIYQNAEQGGSIPWAEGQASPLLADWAQHTGLAGDGRRALVVGCGTGDDAEFLDRRGFVVDAFDVAESAIRLCRQRFPFSTVDYSVADVLQPPAAWRQRYDLVLECRTLQALPWQFYAPAVTAIAGCVRPGGQLLVLCLGREPEDSRAGIPWPLSRPELALFEQQGLAEVSFEDLPLRPRRHFRVVYRRPPV
ncbi:MAG: class I SAM-dependent methyltransferase [Anaerolineae bacterium]|jgi:SAM-dependent methyltransferase|nr:class I SAM-dependent methyltransferase [Anaerolineae bacterium]